MSLLNVDSSVSYNIFSSGRDTCPGEWRAAGLYCRLCTETNRVPTKVGHVSEQERQETNMDIHETYPLVALKNMVVFPRTRMTLAIAREKSVRAVEEAMIGPDHTLIASAQRDPEVDDPQPKDIYPTGTLVEITTIHHQQDGSLQILLNGLRRVQIDEFLDLEPFIRVSVNTPQEAQHRGPQADALVRHAISLFERYAQLNRRF